MNYWMFDVGCRMFDVGCSMFAIGYRLSAIGYKLWDVGCSMLDVRCSGPRFNPLTLSLPLKTLCAKLTRTNFRKIPGVLPKESFAARAKQSPKPWAASRLRWILKSAILSTSRYAASLQAS